MVVGGVATIWRVRSSLAEAIRFIRARAGQGEGAGSEDDGQDIPGKAIVALSVLATALVAGVYYSLTSSLAVTAITTVIMIVMSLFFTAVASYIVGLVGNSNSPVSGMTITAVLFTGVMLLMFGFTGTEGMVATLGVAAIVCCAACTSGDVCNDLKTGHLVGASPYRQQIMQVIGVATACLVMAPVLQLLHDHTPGGIGGKELAAPQASLFASLAQGFFGDGALPWDMVAVGSLVGVGILIADRILEARGSSFRAHIMPIAVGMYLPFGLATPILLGGLIAHGVTRGAGSEEEEEKLARRGVLYSSGIIAGEALVGVGLALLASMGIARLDLNLPATAITSITVVAGLAYLWDLRRTARRGLGS
jgi:putative OPT family oligopeptide transporter